MSLYSYFRISKPSASIVPEADVMPQYKRLRTRTFWGATAAYSLYYVCRMALSVVKQPLIDEGILTAGQLGLIGSAMLFVYAVGKFCNGFIADYCNVKRFMGWGLLISAAINLFLGVTSLFATGMGSARLVIFLVFALLWGANGWFQSMGAPPGVIMLSRWFPLSHRGTWYSIFSSTPYLGKFLTFILTGFVVGHSGWAAGFLFSGIIGLAGAVIIWFFVSDTPESQGLPSVQELSGEGIRKADTLPTIELQKMVFRHPGIWIIAISSAFIYITQYAVNGWGVLFLQKSKGFSLSSATQIIAFSEAFGVLGTIGAGWLSDRVFRGDRVKPVAVSGIFCLGALAAFLITEGSYIANILYVSIFSLAIGVLYCIVAGLMAVDIVPRKATGAALGIVGISSYVAAGLQDIVSGYLIQGGSVSGPSADAASKAGDIAGAAALGNAGSWDFTPVAIFWIAACLISFILPILNWKRMRAKLIG